MKKIIQITSILLQVLAVFLYVGIIKSAVALQSGDMDGGTFLGIIIFAALVQGASSFLRYKFPKEFNNAEDVFYTKKELEEKEKGIKKTPILVKILLVIPITFAVLVVLAGLYTVYAYFSGNI